jgi:C4-dicarboxylate transporter, DctM subunit
MGPSLLVLILLIALLVIGMPVALSVGLVSAAYLFLTDVNFIAVPQRMFTTVDSSTLFAVPLFLLAGFLMNTSGVTSRIFRFARSIVGHVTGGLAHVNVVASMIFASMSGSSVADAAGLGAVEIRAMTDAGYDKDFSCAVTLASCTISPIIPPSIIMVIYGITAGVSIGRLFIAGFIPGIMMGLLLMATNVVLARRHAYPTEPRASLAEIGRTFLGALLPLFTPVIIIGGILGGVFTATEAAAMAVVYTVFLDVFIYRELTWAKFRAILLDVALTSAAILFLVATTGIFGWILAREQVPVEVMQFFLSLTSNPSMIMFLIVVVLLILGTFLDATPIVLLMVPVLMPLLREINYDPVLFGVVISIATMIGLTTPPVGVSLYSVSAVSGVPVERIIRKLLPYWVALVAALLLITFVPAFSLTLPDLLFR